MLSLAEICLALLALPLAYLLPAVRRAGEGIRKLEGWGGRLARNRALSILLIGAAAPAIRLSMLGTMPIPEPAAHDEFSYALAGETFAAGRLTNPTHPMWRHFESFHIEHQPSYMSMYPPVQGLILAAGRVMFGHPWYGVCLSVGLMSAAICWMLYGWLPPGWALVGGLLAVVRLGVFGYWMNSYWGGAASALGGALLLGAMPRLMRRPGAATACLMGLGIVILANSRPYEGLLLSSAAAFGLAAWVARKRPPVRILLMRAALPMALVLAAAAAGMGYYNWRVFGSPLTMPYEINRSTYATSPILIWQPMRPEPPQYRHPVMRDFYVNWELPQYLAGRTARGFAIAAGKKAIMLFFYFLGPILLLGLIGLPRTLRDRRIRFLLLTAAIFFIGISANPFNIPHYLAPATSVFFAIVLQSMRHLRLWRPDGVPAGRRLAQAIPALAVIAFALPIAPRGSLRPEGPQRGQVAHVLEKLPGGQLAIVRYRPGHDPNNEWVYNAADIDAAKVVWAREMGAGENRELLEYYRGRRRAWLIEPDVRPPRISPYIP